MILLGSTGSIGQNTLAIARTFSLSVDVLVAGRSIELLNQQIAEFKPSRVVVALQEDIKRVHHHNVHAGSEAILEALEASDSKLVVNALVGFLGLAPTLKAIELGKRVALANKESLVAAGAFVDSSKIIPIDSEHFGLWYLHTPRAISRMLITASGGAFRDWPIEALQNATLADTQKHPNWSMGEKITIDSATMVNKLFELLEARWLFGVGTYDAIIERHSLFHALIDYIDGSTTAHIAHANMQLPIAYALGCEIDKPLLKPVDLVQLGSIEFEAIDTKRYAVWELKEELLKHPEKGVIVNAANEAAIEKFIAKKCRFTDIAKSILKAYEHFDTKPQSIEEVFSLDREVRAYVAT